MHITSPAFEPGKRIPQHYAYRSEGDNVSPPLSWSDVPADARSLVIIVEDPDAPSPRKPRPKPWVHWVLYNIPADRTALEEGETGGGILGQTDFGEWRWGGPLPPQGSGQHRYVFHIYALDTRLDLMPGATRDEVLAALEGHVLDHGAIYGTYTRD